MDEARKKEVIQKLTEKGAVKECPRCGNKGFSLIDQYTNIILQDNIGGIVIGGPTVPKISQDSLRHRGGRNYEIFRRV